MLGLRRAPADNRVTEVRITYAGGRWVGPHSLLEEDELAVPEGAVVTLRNQTDGSVLALLEDLEWTRDATTATQAATLPEFRELFSSEVLAPGRHLALRHVSLLFSSIEGSTQLYEELGDAAAYSLIGRHFEFIRTIVERAEGALVKTIGDGTMCAFHRVDDAVEAAITIQRELQPWCESQEIDPPLIVKLGLHYGPAIATTANDRLDYLGRTANLAAWLRDEGRGSDVVVLHKTLEQLTTSLEGRTDLSLEPLTPRAPNRDSEHELIRMCVRAPSDTKAESPSAAR